MPYNGVPADKTEKMEQCVRDVMKQGHDKSSAIAICHTSIMKEAAMNYTDRIVEALLTESSQSFFDAYVECALWSSTDESDESGGEPMDKNYGPEDIDSSTLARMRQDCERFQRDNAVDLQASGLRDERAGHDFWLNRNGHGSGFWDEGNAPVFQRLSNACKSFGEFDLIVGDDGKIHGM